MLDERRRLAHSYAVSYEMEVGSSLDPNMEDPSRWEESTSASTSTQPHPARGLGPPKEPGDCLYHEDERESDYYDDFDFDSNDGDCDDFLPPSDDNVPPLGTTPAMATNSNHHFSSDDFDADSSWADAYIASLPPNGSLAPESLLSSNNTSAGTDAGGEVTSSPFLSLNAHLYTQYPHAAAASPSYAQQEHGGLNEHHANQPALVPYPGISGGHNDDSTEDVAMA